MPLLGVQSLPSTLSQYDLASHLQFLQLEPQQLGRRKYEHLSQPQHDGLSHPQLDSLRRGNLDSLTSSQLEALLIRANTLSSSRSSNPSLGSSPPTSLTNPSPALLHTQSLAPTAVHSIAPTPTHPHSLTSSPHLGFASTSSTSFASLNLPLPLGTDALNTKLPSHSGVGKNADSLSLKLKTDTKLGSDLHLLSSKNTSRTSSFSTPSSLADGMSFSQRPSFVASQSQRPSFSSSTSQRPSFSSTSQRPSFGNGSVQRPAFSTSSLLQGPFFDDERESISQPVSLSTSRANSGSSTGASSLPPTLTRPTSGVGHDTTLTSPPASGGWPRMSIPRPTSPKSAKHTLLSSDSSNKSQSPWGASSKVGSIQGSTPAKAEGSGNIDAIATALGSLGVRRFKAQAYKAAEKEKVSSSDPKPTSPSPQKPTSLQKPSRSSSRRQPGPISLPPPTFTLQHPQLLSPQHPQSPIYYAGYAPSHPVSPLYHPAMNSPVHHPTMSPLLHPSVHSYQYHMHYGVMTPHGLPPITPSMPPFTFQPQQKVNDRANLTERLGSNEGSRQGQATEARSGAPPPSSPYHHPPHNHIPYLPPHMFSPGIPLSPGIMIPMSPGYPSPMTMVPLTPSGVPLPMTPGVTMTPGTFWPHAPWINPAPGAPVHAGDHQHDHGYSPNPGGDYFPPQGEPDNNTGYFPPVSSLANEIFKEGSEFHSSSREEDSQSGSSSACAGMVSPVPKSMQKRTSD